MHFIINSQKNIFYSKNKTSIYCKKNHLVKKSDLILPILPFPMMQRVDIELP